jgi:hypothetical protein
LHQPPPPPPPTATLPGALPRNNQNDALVVEDYSTLSHFLLDGLHETPPVQQHNYITEGSEKILNRINYQNRPPLHYTEKYLPPIRGSPRDEENEENRWDRTMEESHFANTEYYRKERERVEAKRKERCARKYVKEEQIDAIVNRMVEFAHVKEQRRVNRMKKQWDEEVEMMRRKKKKEKRRRRLALKRMRRTNGATKGVLKEKREGARKRKKKTKRKKCRPSTCP